MLLPSLLPCDGANRPIASARPTFLISQEPIARSAIDNPLNSCRALQSILGGYASNASNITIRPQRPRLLRSPAHTILNRDSSADPPRPQVRDRTLPFQSSRKHKLDDSAPIQSTSQCHGRSFSDASTVAATSPVMKQPPVPSPMFDQENNLSLSSAPIKPLPRRHRERSGSDSAREDSPYFTPKRRRLAPLSMPLGLSASDFESLNMPPGYGPQPPTTNSYLPTPSPSNPSETPSSCSSPVEKEEDTSDDWLPTDDLALVSILLEKSRLSKRDWNDCARILGKDRDSLGRRWRYLLGSGEVGLRRGRGSERSRARLEQMLEGVTDARTEASTGMEF